VKLPEGLRRTPLTPSIDASPRPSPADDPRSGHERRVPGLPGGAWITNRIDARAADRHDGARMDQATTLGADFVESDSFSDQQRVGYGFSEWMRVLCSGFRAAAAPD
jgi:hypothetical protein